MPRVGEGLVLEFHWKLNFLNVPREQRQSREEIHCLLSQARVELCTHSMLSDPRIATAVYRLLYPGEDVVDPIDMWEAGCNNGTTTVTCEECASLAEIHGVGRFINVDSKRYLGRGESSTDSRWLAQCGVRGGILVNEELA